MEEEADKTNAMYDAYRTIRISEKRTAKSIIGNMLPQRQKQKVKRILQILKEK